MTFSEDQRNEAAQVLQQALVTIRELTVFRNQEPRALSSEARLTVGYLADAVHNLPDWLNGSGYPDNAALKDIEQAKRMIEEARSVCYHGHNLTRRATSSRRLTFWNR